MKKKKKNASSCIAVKWKNFPFSHWTMNNVSNAVNTLGFFIHIHTPTHTYVYIFINLHIYLSFIHSYFTSDNSLLIQTKKLPLFQCTHA